MKMNSPNRKVIPFPLASKADAELQQARNQIARGTLSASAPCDGMYNDWTDDDKQRFKDALGSIFGWKKKD